jgi:DNA-binding NarL/FixJ family response regulator
MSFHLPSKSVPVRFVSELLCASISEPQCYPTEEAKPARGSCAYASSASSRGELSPRERQVLERAILGSENKVIAYDLGLADSTVRVLMRRAAIKLGARTRAGAIEAYRRLRSGGPIENTAK